MSTRPRRLVGSLALPLALLLVVGLASAAGPATQDVSGQKAFADGTLEDLSLDQDGILRPGPAFEPIDLAAPSAWAATRSGGATWIGTGNAGEVLRVAEDGKVQRIGTGDNLMVTAVAPLPGGGVAAAVAPGGRILKVSPTGEASTLAALPVEYVWALLPASRGGVVAATGSPAALYRIDAFGGTEKITDVEDDHARCLVRHGEAWLIGTAPKGLVISHEGGENEILRDLDAREVVGLAVLGDEGLLVAANADQAGGNVQVLTTLVNQMINEPATKPGQKPPKRPALQDGQVLWLEPNGAVTTLWTEKKVAALSLVKDGDGAVLGTYPSGRLIRVEPRRAPALLADLPEAEASVLFADEDGLQAVVTSNPAVLHRLKQAAPGGTFTSKPLDAGAVARWGRIRTSGRDVTKVEIRSGETEEPDDTWSPWAEAVGFDGREGSTGASARFLQARITLEGEDAELRSISVVLAAPNRAPVVEELKVATGSGKKDAPPKASPTRQITWKAKDPDGDTIHTRLEAQREGSPLWIALVEDEVLAKPQWTWDTSGLPDGVYRLRLTLDDTPDNPPSLARTTVRFTSPFRVDNTAPHVEVRARVAGDRLLVEGTASDQPGGRVAAVRVSIDGGPWRVMAARDGLMDETKEAFEASLPRPETGPHDVVVQARDADGNLGAGATVVSVR